MGKNVRIKKMTQKYDLNPSEFAPLPENQKKKTVFNMDTGEVTVDYHYKSGKITAA